MDNVISRYRNVTALVLVLGAQLLLLAFQVKRQQELTPVRVWAVTGFMPVARLLGFARYYTVGMVERFASLTNAQTDNTRLQIDLDKLKLENQFLKNELATADRGRALAMFQATSPHRLLAARVVGSSTAPGSRVLFLDRGRNDGVMKSMAVITPDGIAGRITSTQPSGSQLMLLTDTNFSASVISEKGRVMGIAKGQGHSSVLVDYVQNDDKVELEEMFYTAGDDWIFPKGLPVGKVKVSRRGRGLFKEIFIDPMGLQRGLENVLILLEGVHQSVPPDVAPLVTGGAEAGPAEPTARIAPPPSTETAQSAAGGGKQLPIDADQILNKYDQIGKARGQRLGAGTAPDFSATPPEAGPAAKPKP